MVVFFEKGPEKPVPDLGPVGSLSNRGEGGKWVFKDNLFLSIPSLKHHLKAHSLSPRKGGREK
jgi:hypothetical protein